MSAAWQWLSGPWGEAFMQHAFLEVALVGLLGGWLGCWVLLYGVSYSAESLSHGMFPGLVGASLLGLPLLAGGVLRARGGGPLLQASRSSAAPAGSTATPRSASSSPRCSGWVRCWHSRRPRRRAS